MTAFLPLIGLVLTTLFVACLPIALYWRVHKTLAPDWHGAVAGIAVFALCVMVIERGLNAYVMSGEWLSSRVAFVAYTTLVVGACEETGRFIAMQMLYRRAVKRGERDESDGRAEKSVRASSMGFGYGIGHGGAQAWLSIVLPKSLWLVSAVYSIVKNAGEYGVDLENLLPFFSAWILLVAVADFIFQIGLSVLMWRGVRSSWKSILPLAILAHGLLCLPFALRQVQALPLAAFVAAILYVLAAVIVAVALWRVYRANRLAVRVV